MPVPHADAMRKKNELHAVWQLQPQPEALITLTSTRLLVTFKRTESSCTVNAHTHVPDASLRQKHVRLLVGRQGRVGAQPMDKFDITRRCNPTNLLHLEGRGRSHGWREARKAR